MDMPKWTDEMQAWTSLGTAIFTFISVVLIGVYTWLTRATLKVTNKATHESLRPVLVLVRMELSQTARAAVFQNAGQGVAIALAFQTDTGQPIEISSNVLAPHGELFVDLPLISQGGVMDIGYKSIEGREFRTVSSFSELGKVFNKYLPDSHELTQDNIKKIYASMKERALLNDAKSYLEKTA